MNKLTMRLGIQGMGLLSLLIPVSLWGNDFKKEPTVIFFTAYCYEADMTVSETIFPALPAETSIRTVQNMAKVSGDYTRQLQSIYGYRRFQLLATFGGAIALNLKGISHKCRLESKTKDQKITLSVSAWPQKTDPGLHFSIAGELQFSRRSPRSPVKAELVTALSSGKPICIGGKLPATQGQRAFYIIFIPHYRLIDSQSSYNESMAAFRQVIQMTAGVNELRGQQLIPSLNHWLAQRHPEIQLKSLADLLPAPPPPPPLLINDDGRQVHQYEYDTAPSPVGGWTAFKERLNYPKKAQETGVEGMVVIYTQINSKGNVQGVRIMQSIPPLDRAAIDAIRKTSWNPAQKAGTPLTVWVKVPVIFNLH